MILPILIYIFYLFSVIIILFYNHKLLIVLLGFTILVSLIYKSILLFLFLIVPALILTGIFGLIFPKITLLLGGKAKVFIILMSGFILSFVLIFYLMAKFL